MDNLIKTILRFIRALLGGGEAVAEHSDGALAGVELPPEHPLDDVPVITNASEFAAQSADACVLTIKPDLGNVNLRSGPRLGFAPLALTQGGTRFELVGASEADPDGHRWYSVQVGDESGWVRGDLVQLSSACAERTYIGENEVQPEAPTGPAPDRFPLPVEARISQTYHSGHRGLDMASEMGTSLRAATGGVCIRRVDCTACPDDRPNVYPAAGGCPQLYDKKEWGYGYGNFIVVRHNYADLPGPLRDEMDRQNLTGGFAYVLYAHMSRVDVELGDLLQGGDSLGATGNHGCSSGPHLHFEVRIGNDEVVDGRWLQQRPVNPDLMFVV